MNTGKISFCVLVFVLTAGLAGFAAAGRAGQPPQLQIYLPRKVIVKDSSLTLGSIGIIRGDEKLAAKAAGVALGQISVPGQEVVINSSAILSRLACSGIDVSKVTLTGAERVTAKQHKNVIDGGDFVALARAFLKGRLADRSISELKCVRTPQSVAVPETAGNIETTAGLLAGEDASRVRVKISVLADGVKLTDRQVDFRLKYNCRQAVTVCDIAPSEVITARNIKVERAVCDRPEPPGWTAPYGSLARRRLRAGTVLLPNMLKRPQGKVIIERNQSVLIKFEKPGLVVTAVGKALQQARAGDYLKVRNVDSQRIILTRAGRDGTVEPVF